MKKKILGFFIFLMLMGNVESYSSTENIGYIASFNTLHLGWKGKDYKKTAEVLMYFDLVGLQEVMKKEGLVRLAKALEDETGVKWNYHISKMAVGNKEV